MAMTALRSIGVITSEIQNIRKARDFRGKTLWKEIQSNGLSKS